MARTYILDIDGTLLEQSEDFSTVYTDNPRALDSAREKTAKWHCYGDRIILMTGRCESLRKVTETQLENAGIFYDILLMGCGSGPRILVNDIDELGRKKAFAFNVKRNVDGLKDIP